MARIAYLSWPAGEIAGGIKAAFQHVELLREAGFDAVVGTEDARRPAWFETSAPVIGLDAVTASDVLVFPENHAPLLARFAGGPNPKAVFFQSVVQAWRGLADHDSYSAYGVTHLLCPSHTALQFCARRHPGLKTLYTPFYVDHSRFVCPPAKRVQVACVPRKRPSEAMVIRDLFRAGYPQFRNVDWVLIQNAPETHVAEVMGQSAVFLSLARLEVHCMTTLEAMASGCIVAGFSGNTGHNDSATAGNGFWAAEDDLMGCTDQLARATQLVATQGPAYQAMVTMARHTAYGYRREEAARLLTAAWASILGDIAA